MTATRRRFDRAAVLITGASAGIGAEVVRRFAREGARLALAARRPEPLEAVAREVRELGAEAIAIPTDVGDPAACERLVASTVEALGGLDVLVNDAGAHFRGPFTDVSAREVATMVDVNARAPLVLTSHALPHLKRSRGAIVSVASIAGMAPLPGAAVYSATKFALRAFSLALAEELRGTGVSVSLVSPGPLVDTGFLMEHMEDAADIVFSQPMSTAEEIAEMVVECARDGRRERTKPAATSMLATLSYLLPGLRRAFEPAMKRHGARVKARLLSKRRP
jgi:short-subunit dehydrogenase